jgi:multidrug transporter EmrE-like cation transporter
MFPIVVLYVFFISASEALAQSLSYLAKQQSSVFYFVASWLVYLLIVYLLFLSYQYKGVGYINVLWSGMTTVLMILIGYFIFGERLSQIEWVGVFFIVFGMVLMVCHKITWH